MPVLFNEAKEHDELKQPYLETLMQYAPESVAGLVYDPGWTQSSAYIDHLVKEGLFDPQEALRAKAFQFNGYYCVLALPSLVATKRKHPIFISQKGFDVMKDESYFLSSLLDHEAFHTDDLANGIHTGSVIIDSSNVHALRLKALICIMERRAYKNQIAHLADRGISDKSFMKWLSWHLEDYASLSLPDPKTELEQQLGF